MLNDEGNAFAQACFDFEKGKFVSDYEELLCADLPTVYHVQNSWENYDALRRRLDQRFEEWKTPPKRRFQWFRGG